MVMVMVVQGTTYLQILRLTHPVLESCSLIMATGPGHCRETLLSLEQPEIAARRSVY